MAHIHRDPNPATPEVFVSDPDPTVEMPLSKAKLLAKYEDLLRDNLQQSENEGVYSRQLVQVIRDSIKMFQTVACPMPESELQRIGIDRGTMRQAPAVSVGNQRRRGGRNANRQRPPRVVIPRAQPNGLVRGDDAWVPGARNVSEIKKFFKGRLNMLTTSNYDELSQQLMEKQVWNNPENLPAIIDLIFKKAVDEPTFVGIYADLCKTIHQAEISTARNEKRFYKMIIKKCQTTFEQSTIAPTTDDPHIAKELVEVKVADQKRTMIGTIRFIAELYRIKFLNNQVVNHCVVILLRKCNRNGNNSAEGFPLSNVNELMIEYCIVLVQSIRPHCVAHPAPETPLAISGYIDYLVMFKLSVCNRIRFMLQDLEASNRG
uniref:MIF4G domain-containing protein n=1 Tax=Panagrellus redivivus TaxID=6233 RepID=A0A7E4VYD9_PANRE